MTQNDINAIRDDAASAAARQMEERMFDDVDSGPEHDPCFGCNISNHKKCVDCTPEERSELRAKFEEEPEEAYENDPCAGCNPHGGCGGCWPSSRRSGGGQGEHALDMCF